MLRTPTLGWPLDSTFVTSPSLTVKRTASLTLPLVNDITRMKTAEEFLIGEYQPRKWSTFYFLRM
jgi:hypothetical protein